MVGSTYASRPVHPYTYGKARTMSTRIIIVTCHWRNGHVNAKSFHSTSDVTRWIDSLGVYVRTGMLVKVVIS